MSAHAEAATGTGIGTEEIVEGAKVLMVDNYDSFTWNLYQYLCLLGAEVTVVRSQSCTLEELVRDNPTTTHLVISPGPGHPLTDSGISIPALQHYAGKIPVLGVCMGLQCMYAAYGGVVDGAGEIVHGKTSAVNHDGKGLFTGLSQGIQSTRYHSLAARIGTLPPDMEITSRTSGGGEGAQGEGIVMGIRHKVHAMEAVQYHPESILSQEGKIMMANFLRLRGGTWAENPGYGLGLGDATPDKVAAASSAASRSMPSSSALPTILEKICKQRLVDVANAKATPGGSPADLAAKIALHVPPPQIDFHKRLLRSGSSVSSPDGTPHVALLAEIKRASPSKGSFVTAATPSPPEIALSYATAGASSISVLTEPTWFKGTLMDMLSVRLALENVPNRPAVLRKDFILESYQIDEARCYGADSVLLIVACLQDAELSALYHHSLSLGMEPLVEVNNPAELTRALKLGAKVIGVNNRNLHDFEVDMGTTSRLADVIRASKKGGESEEVVLCALSGITGRADVVRYIGEGVGAVLVGEALMRAKDKGAFVRTLLGTGTPETSSTPQVGSPKSAVPTPPLVKICGIKTPEAGLAAAEAGADFLGFVFAPKANAKSPSNKPKPSQSRPFPLCTRFSVGLVSAFPIPRAVLCSWGFSKNASLEEVLSTLDAVPLDVVQLHGNEPIEWARLLNVPVIKAFHVAAGATSADENSLKEVARTGYHAIPLLDTQVGKGGLSGGAGKAFDWSVAKVVADRESAIAKGTALGRLPLILAGGLEVETVAKAVKQVAPWAVDVSGGVETDGEKDLDKVREFIKVVKAAFA